MKKFVVCGDSRQYFAYLKANGFSPQNHVYVHSIEQLRGHSEVHGVFCGTYRERDDIQDIVRAIKWINRIPASQWLIPPSPVRPTPRKPK